MRQYSIMEKAVWLTAIIVTFLEGCNSREILPSAIENGVDYYPIKTGNSWIYQVDTIRYIPRLSSGNSAVKTDTLKGRYYLKEIIADSIGLQEGNPFFRVEQYISAEIDGPWMIDSVWSIQRGIDKILKTENNRPIVKLKYPLREGGRWDGNQYNNRQDSSGNDWFTSYDVGKEYYFQNNPFVSVLIVHKSDSNCLTNTRIWERYLKGIGPAFIQKLSLVYSQEGTDPCGKLPVIESGKERIFTLLRFENKN